MFWITPVMTICVLVGLALDYDVFLYDRIYEYRLDHWDDTSAIILGVYQTGTIITAAGCIMTIAFATLMWSEIPCMNQFGFILTFAVLIDTFIIRTALVPAILSMAGPINWYPGKVPPAHKSLTSFTMTDLSVLTSKHEQSKYLKVNGPAPANDSLRSSHAMDAGDNKMGTRKRYSQSSGLEDSLRAQSERYGSPSATMSADLSLSGATQATLDRHSRRAPQPLNTPDTAPL